MINFDPPVFIKYESFSEPGAVSRFQSDLACWFGERRRDLPWRAPNVSPWGILMSEIMLQQTTVAAVMPYWFRFMERFPTPRDLAEASEDEVLSMWSGLGYYRRARNLQAAARVLAGEHDNRVPADYDAILALPGIGRYTAGAVASFAFRIPAPIVEANSARVLARLGCMEGPVNERLLWQSAQDLLSQEDPRTHNYALMELGSLICKPVPLCGECPVSRFCLARHQGKTSEVPAAKAKPEKVNVVFAGCFVQRGRFVLLRRIPEGEWHSGMMELPKVRLEDRAEAHAVPAKLTELLSAAGIKVPELLHWKSVRYVVTKHKVTLDVWRGRLRGAKQELRSPDSSELEWVSVEQLESVPCGTATRRLLQAIMEERESEL